MASKTKSFLLLLGRRAYTTVADNVKKAQTGVKSPGTIMGSKEKGVTGPEPVFWMRHPKTGYYVPETHFDEVDAADLRYKFLSNKY